MKELSINKDKVPVTITYPDGSKGKGNIFLAPYTNEHHGHQKVSDLLNGEKIFLPISLDNDTVEFVSKAQVMTIEGELIAEDDIEMMLSGLVQQKDITVVLEGNTTIVGTLLAEAPIERSRLSDCLNQPDNFLKVKTESKYLHINKSFIKKITARNI